MGFLNDFAQGFFDTSAQTLNDRRKVQMEVDAARKKAIDLVQPQEELYRRQKAIDLENTKALRKFNMDSFAEMLSSGSTGVAGSQAVSGPQVTNPTATPPTDIVAVHNMLQDALDKQAKAYAAGDTQTANFFNTQAEKYKAQYQFLADQKKQGDKPAVGAEGSNIVETIQKRNADIYKTNSGERSRYMPTKLQSFANDPATKAMEEQSSVSHQALAQAVAAAKKDQFTSVTPEVTSQIVAETEQVIKDINTVKSDNPSITPEDKAMAAKNVQEFLQKLSPEQVYKLTKDPNFLSVFTEDTAMALDSALGAATTSSQYREGQTATNPTTGEKLIYRNGKWQPR